MALSGIVIVVDEIWPRRCGNEKSARYEVVMVYGTLDACPMGLLSSLLYPIPSLPLGPSPLLRPYAYSGNPQTLSLTDEQRK